MQVAFLLESPAAIERELAAFKTVRDAYPRVLLSLDPHQQEDFDGVPHQSLTGSCAAPRWARLVDPAAPLACRARVDRRVIR